MVHKLLNNVKSFDQYRKKTVAFIFNHSFYLGGGEISFFEFIRSLDQNRFEPIIIVPNNGEIEKELTSLNFQVFVNPILSIKKMFSGLPIIHLLRIINILKNNSVDIIHVNGSRACAYGGVSGRLLGIPVIWHVRETINDFLLYDGLLALLSSAIISVSSGVQSKRFTRFGQRIKTKTNIVYNGIDTHKFRRNSTARYEFRRNLKVDEHILLFGIAGNILPLKGHDFFLKAFAQAKDRCFNLAAKILIIGRPLDSEFDKEIHQLVMDMNLEDDVVFLGHSKNMLAILSALDVFLLPSQREGFSRSLLEAMSVGLPVLATRIDEIEEAVTDGENAILVNYNDVNAMAAAIVKLAEDEQLREKMGKANRKRVVQKFDLASHTKAIQNIYSRLSIQK